MKRIHLSARLGPNRLSRKRNHSKRWLKAVAVALSVLLMSPTIAPSAALAWKPTTHVYLSDFAIADALDNGKVTISKIDSQTGQIVGTIGEYSVDAQLLADLRRHKAQYNAGVLGPDAYPDILTGQQVIHAGPDAGVSGGTNTWLSHIWQQSRSGKNNTSAVRAFTAGYLTHAAGDMYAHTLINNFSGGPFEIKPPDGPTNAIKHVVLEGYIDKRIDARALGSNFFQASIAGVNGFIYRAMVDAKPNTTLSRTLLPKGQTSTKFSIPRIYSTLRANLQRDIDAYYAKKADYDRRYNEKISQGNACGTFDFSCSRTALYAQAAAIQAAKAAYVTGNGIQVTYKEAWRKDIDNGLKVWPQVSHKVATALFFNTSRSANITAAEDELQNYVLKHLLSMSGAPDFVGLTAGVIGDIVDAITPDFLLEPIRQLKEDLLNTLLKEAIGMDKNELAKYLKNPERYFDQVMARGGGQKINLAQFNQNYLNIRDRGFSNPNESFDYRQFPAAYNTVTISKLVLLPKAEINRLLQDLGSRNRLSQDNIMLGFIRSLDTDNEWHKHDHPNPKMALAGDYCAYSQVFMKQTGEKGTPSTTQCQTSATARTEAVVMHPNGKAYFFSQGRYSRFDFATDQVDRAQASIGADGWQGLAQNLDASLLHPNGKAYFFKGNQYQRFDFSQDKVDKTARIGVDGWKGVPANLDAAVMHPNGKAYFFKDNQYYRFDFAQDQVDKVGRIGADGWQGLASGLDSAILHPNGKAYFFKGDRYYRFDFTADQVDKQGVIDRDGWEGL